jgi:serine/threonine protein kinase/WD40 repeat protein
MSRPDSDGPVVERLEPGQPDQTEEFVPTARDSSSAAQPERLGDYRILRWVGEGGMGVVYEAVRETLGAHVALKVLHPQFRTDATFLQRFRNEARSAAGLHHTHIVSVFDFGEQDGVCYYAMQFIQGQGLDKVLDDVRRQRRRDGNGPLPVPNTAALTRAIAQAPVTGAAPSPTLALDRSPPPAALAPARDEPPAPSALAGQTDAAYYRAVARIGAEVAEALALAHSQGVLHRDIKPSNLLLDAHGSAWVTDFGLAKFAEGGDVTATRDVVGTLRYMSPERFDGWSDRRSDVYSLGATLYELLALRPAFDARGQAALIESILHEPPSPLRKVDGRTPRDLETIVHKMLAKEPGDRYPTADAVAEDLRRFLADRTILARPSSTAELLRRWCRRNPIVAGLVAAVAFLLVALALGSTVAAIRLRESRDEAREHLRKARDAEQRKTEQLWEAEVARARAGRFSQRVGQRFESLAALNRAARLGIFPQRRLELRNEAIACLALPDARREQELPVWNGKNIASIYWSAFDGAFEHYAYVDVKGAIVVCRVADGSVVARWPGPGERAQFVRLEFSPGGRWLIVSDRTRREPPALTRAWEVRRGELARPVTLANGRAWCCGFGPDGDTAALLRPDDSLALVELASGREQRRIRLAFAPGPRPPLATARLAPDSRRLAVAEGRLARLFDLETGAEMGRIDHPESIHDVAWSRDGRVLEASCEDRQIYVWEADTRRLISVLEGHQNRAIDLYPSRSGDWVVSRSWDSTTRLWDPVQGRELLSIPGTLAGLSDDGRRIALVVATGQFEVWELADGRESRWLHPGRVGNRSVRPSWGTVEVDFLGSGPLLAIAGDGVRFWDLDRSVEIAALPLDLCETARFAPDGTSLLTYGVSGLRVWPIRTEKGAIQVGPSRRADLLGRIANGFAGWDGAGRLIAASDVPRQEAVLVDPATLAEAGRLGPHPGIRYARLSPDGRWLATSTWRGSNVKVWDAARRSLAWELPCANAIVGFSPDGRRLMTALDGEYRLWHAGTWQPGATIRTSAPINSNFAFAPDGGLLAVDRSGLVRLVDPDTGRELAALEPPPEAPRGTDRLAFSPDGGLLAVPVLYSVIVWDLRQIRAELAALALDWDAPAIAAAGTAAAATAPLRVRALGVDWLAAAWQARDHAREGRWDAAAAAYARATAEGADDPEVWNRHLLLRLRAGDLAGYRAGCAALWQRFGGTSRPETLNLAAWTCALGPDALAEWAATEKAVAAAAAREPGTGPLQSTLGAVLLRAGRAGEAVRALEESIRQNTHGGNAFDWLFLALAQHRLGRSGEARAALEKARDWIAHGDERALPERFIMSPLSWDVRLELELLAREAEAAIAP